MALRTAYAAGLVLSLVTTSTLATCGGASDRPGSDGPASSSGVFVEVIPEPIERPQPGYTAEMARLGLEGTVVLMALVGKEGRVRDIRVIKSIPGLDSAAVEAVRRWTFEPALSNGRPVAFWVQAEVRFPPLPPQGPRSGAMDPGTSGARLPVGTTRRGVLAAADSLTRDVAAWNARLAAAGDSAWALSPARIAIELGGGGDCECARFAIELRNTPERFDTADVTVTYDGLLDDSVRGGILRFSLKRQAGRWRIGGAERMWRCWPGRGHETFGTTPCQ